jgi:hypothetical protein
MVKERLMTSSEFNARVDFKKTAPKELDSGILTMLTLFQSSPYHLNRRSNISLSLKFVSQERR